MAIHCLGLCSKVKTLESSLNPITHTLLPIISKSHWLYLPTMSKSNPFSPLPQLFPDPSHYSLSLVFLHIISYRTFLLLPLMSYWSQGVSCCLESIADFPSYQSKTQSQCIGLKALISLAPATSSLWLSSSPLGPHPAPTASLLFLQQDACAQNSRLFSLNWAQWFYFYWTHWVLKLGDHIFNNPPKKSSNPTPPACMHCSFLWIPRETFILGIL